MHFFTVFLTMASQSSASGEVGHRGFIETSVGAADRVAADSDTRMPNIMPIDKNKLLELKAKLSSPGGEGGPQTMSRMEGRR